MGDPVTVGSRNAVSADAARLARALVATPSVNPSLDPAGEGEAAIAGLTAGWLRGWGFDVRVVDAEPGRPSVLARLERGPGRTLILNGHLDTVGVAGMDGDPFAADVRDGRLRGRGAADMKGGVAAALAAARDAAAGDFAGTLVVALTADEEAAAIGAHRLVAEGLSGDAAVVCEPTGLALMPAHKGFTWIALDFHGRAAHGSRPERGVDAIRHAGLFLARLDELDARLAGREPHPLLGHGSIHAGTIRGGTAPSVYPASARLVLERRTLPGETAGAVRSEVEELLEGLRIEVPGLRANVDVALHRDGTEVAVDHALVGTLSRAVEGAGLAARVDGMSAWVEAGILNGSGTPAVCFGPGRIEDAHSPDESVAVEEIEVAHRVLGTFIQEFLS